MDGADMDGVEIDAYAAPDDSGDLAAALLSRFHASPREDHQHLCAAVGAISQTLKDKSVPLTPVAYFAAASSSLHRLPPSDPAAASLLTFLSLLLPNLPAPVLLRSLPDALLRTLAFGSLPDTGVKAALKCISHLLTLSKSSISPLYTVLLGFITDPRPKVRKQAHSCVCDVLRSFQGTPVLAPACEGITTVFERFLLLAGASKSASATAAAGEGAMEVLYILSALKDCLPLMSLKFANVILKYCKTLLDLRQTVVTRSVMDILQAVCLSPISEVGPDLLLELLSALSASDKEKSADALSSIARLLHVGTKKVYDLNRDVCVVKLPAIFSSLGDILASEHDEAIYGATEALQGLIGHCIDERLLKQGLDQIGQNPRGGVRNSTPTIIEKLCATLEGLLHYRYEAVRDMTFQILSTAFNQMGESSSYLMAGTIRNLADMHKLPDEDFPYRKQLHECVGSALAALGPETFLRILPLKLEADISDVDVWLLPILKQYTVGARLSYFSKCILYNIRLIQQKSHKLEKEGRIVSARNADGLVYSLWSLLPAFCNYPVDTGSSFKILQKALCSTLREEADLRGIICNSLQILIRQNMEVLSGSVMPDYEISKAERKARDNYTLQVAEENLKVIQSFSMDFFSALSETFLTSAKDDGGCLQSTIREFASISDKKVVKKFFTTTMQKLLKVTRAIGEKQKNNSSSMQIDNSSTETSLSDDRALLLDLAVTLLPGLGEEEIKLLFCVIKPAFQDSEGIIQKRAYKILSIILKERNEFTASNLDVLLELLISVTPSCHFSAKRHRLESLYHLIVYISKDSSEQKKTECISAFLTEIILALKEANKKTRNRAYDLLVEIGHACGDEERGGKKENLEIFFNTIVGGLASGAPHMISAAVKGLARLTYEFSDLVGTAYNFLPSAFLLLQRRNREIVKANLGLMKVLVAKSQADRLQMHLQRMVEGLLKWQDDTKSHFKAKVKLLIEMLVRKCGLDAVKAVMPEEHMKLLTNIRKTKERKERKAKSEEDEESLHSRSVVSRQSKWNHTRIFSDFGDDDEDSDPEQTTANTESGRLTKFSSMQKSKVASQRSVRKPRRPKRLPEDLLDQSEGEPLDLLDRQRTRSALRTLSSHQKDAGSNDEPEIDSEGRLVVREGQNRSKKQKIVPSDNDSDKRSRSGSRSSAQSRPGSRSSAQSRPGSRSSARSLGEEQQKRRKTSDSGWAYTGNMYTSKKASGDVKKKDKLDPYAYWPLDRKLLNRRAEHKAAARKGMAGVMKMAKGLEGRSVSGALMKLSKKKRKQSS